MIEKLLKKGEFPFYGDVLSVADVILVLLIILLV